MWHGCSPSVSSLIGKWRAYGRPVSILVGKVFPSFLCALFCFVMFVLAYFNDCSEWLTVCFFFQNLVADKVTLILQAYVRVLTQGRTHLFHVMPRMLTIWLDNAQKKVRRKVFD